MLLPNNIVPMNLAGCFKNLERIFAEKIPLFLSNSIFNLLAETNAISKPENSAEANIDSNKIIQKREVISNVNSFLKVSDYFDIFSNLLNWRFLTKNNSVAIAAKK